VGRSGRAAARIDAPVVTSTASKVVASREDAGIRPGFVRDEIEGDSVRRRIGCDF